MSMATRYDLEQDGTRQALIAAMAAGEPTAALVREYGVTRQALFEFRRRHAAEIEAIVERTADELAEMWVAVKRERVAALMDDLEEAEARLSASSHAEGESLALDDFLALGNFRRANLRAVAEELGQIPNKITAQVEGRSVITYRLEAGTDDDGQAVLDAI